MLAIYIGRIFIHIYKLGFGVPFLRSGRVLRCIPCAASGMPLLPLPRFGPILTWHCFVVRGKSIKLFSLFRGNIALQYAC